MSELKPLNAAVAAYFAAKELPWDGNPAPLSLVPSTSDWTDEQWAEHDARVKTDYERECAKEREEERAHNERRFLKQGWPQRAIESARSADDTKPAVARVLAWESQKESVLVLSGAAGCGKTTAAARWATSKSSWCQFLRATTFAASSRYDHEKRDGWLKANALVLDDLGAEYADTKGNFLVDLDELVDTFYGDKRPLLITTNCDATAFKARYGARIVDRIRECGSWFSISGESMRRKS